MDEYVRLCPSCGQDWPGRGVCPLCRPYPRCAQCGGKIEAGSCSTICYGCRIDQVCAEYGHVPMHRMPPTGIDWLDVMPLRICDLCGGQIAQFYLGAKRPDQ